MVLPPESESPSAEEQSVLPVAHSPTGQGSMPPLIYHAPVPGLQPGQPLPRELRPRPPKSTAFDLSNWHGAPTCTRVFVPGIGGIGVKICCSTCGVLADVEATGQRIPVTESFQPLGSPQP